MLYRAGDQYLGALTGPNWWFRYDLGVFMLRNGTITHGALGNLNGCYDYQQTTYGSAFGLDQPGAPWLAMDETNGFRIMKYKTRVFHVDMAGNAAFGYAGQSEVKINPGESLISFVVDGVTQSAWDSQGRTIYGIERLGRPLGPCIEWGPIPDPSGDASLERFGFWLRMRANASSAFGAATKSIPPMPACASARRGRTTI